MLPEVPFPWQTRDLEPNVNVTTEELWEVALCRDALLEDGLLEFWVAERLEFELLASRREQLRWVVIHFHITL